MRFLGRCNCKGHSAFFFPLLCFFFPLDPDSAFFSPHSAFFSPYPAFLSPYSACLFLHSAFVFPQSFLVGTSPCCGIPASVWRALSFHVTPPPFSRDKKIYSLLNFLEFKEFLKHLKFHLYCIRNS